MIDQSDAGGFWYAESAARDNHNDPKYGTEVHCEQIECAIQTFPTRKKIWRTKKMDTNKMKENSFCLSQ